MLDEFRSTSITWDKATRRIYSPITANASDSNGRKLNIQVVNSGQVENLTGATLHLYWETKDKVHDGLDAFTASDISKGEFELFYTTGMLSNVGELNATLVLVDNTGKVVSDWFKITVTRGINEGAIESENSFSSLTQALIDISNLEQNYAPRLNDLTAQLQQSMTNIVTILPSGIDDTEAIQSVLDANDIPRLVDGEYIVSTLILNDNAKIVTSGYKTKLKQKTGLPGDTRLLNIVGSNIVVDEMTYEGNIATDTGEQMHAVFIRNNTKTITNIEVKGIVAKNIRGDGLYIGGNTLHNPTNVKIGNIITDNTFRNGFSITGGINVQIGDLFATRCGMLGFDLESDTQGGKIKNVKIGNVVCANVGILASGDGYPFVEDVTIGFITCRQTAKGSEPAFHQAVDTDKDGITFRNAKNIHIKGLNIDGFDRFAVHFLISTGDRLNDSITIESLTMNNCSRVDTTYNSYVNLAGINTVKVNHVNSTTQLDKTTFKGTSKTATGQNIIIGSAKHSGGTFVGNCGLYASNLDIVSEPVVATSLKTLSRIINSTLRGSTIFGYSDNVIIEGCTLTYTTAKESGGINIFKNNVINGTFTV